MGVVSDEFGLGQLSLSIGDAVPGNNGRREFWWSPQFLVATPIGTRPPIGGAEFAGWSWPFEQLS